MLLFTTLYEGMHQIRLKSYCIFTPSLFRKLSSCVEDRLRRDKARCTEFVVAHRAHFKRLTSAAALQHERKAYGLPCEAGVSSETDTDGCCSLWQTSYAPFIALWLKLKLKRIVDEHKGNVPDFTISCVLLGLMIRSAFCLSKSFQALYISRKIRQLFWLFGLTAIFSIGCFASGFSEIYL